MAYRCIARLVVAIFGLAVISAGCADSPSSPTPDPAPVTPAPAGLTLGSLSPNSGPTAGGDTLRISGTGFKSGVAVIVDGAAVEVTRVTGAYVDALTVAHAEGTVDVIVRNPDGESKILSGGYSFTAAFYIDASPGTVETGGALSVSWQTPAGRGCRGGGDWIALYRVGDPDATGAVNGHSDLWYEHVCGVASGAWTIKAPADAGVYEFRFMVGGLSVARSHPVTVG